ncbi:uncharacterized protein PAC_17621 [Phialocephala subalpina]|uniref:Uncharacterized protein n=1 Tax=Phialocephala subalpina TaxID=576137 RepID=A0A1L7XRP5_9HELO|nr:uncharacterized protein PAC_17621 [Phialocephala subalpina]
MFEHFTFGAQAQTLYAQHEDSFPSPTDCSFRLETPPPTSCYEGEVSRGGISDIVDKFSEQSLRPDEDERPQRSIWNNTLPIPDFDNDMEEFTPEELSYISTKRGKVTLEPHSQSLPNLPAMSRNGTVACRRLQRQLNVQLQTCNSHIRDISALVEDMISTSSQCRLYKSTSRPYLNSPLATPFVTEPLELDVDDEEPRAAPGLHEDEGFAEMEDNVEDEFSLRRASTPSGIRKFGYNLVRYRSSGECVRGAKVRCVPRMRRRKPRPIVE